MTEIKPGKRFEEPHKTMSFQNSSKSVSLSEPISDQVSIWTTPQRKYALDPYISKKSHEIGKAEMLQFLALVSSTRFTGRTGASDKQTLIALVEQSLDHTVGRSSIRPGTRNISVSTGRNLKTSGKAVDRLIKQGWIRRTSNGNRMGKATNLRPCFENPPVTVSAGGNQAIDLHPLVFRRQELWTKFALGENARIVLQFLYEYSSGDNAATRLTKAEITRQTGIGHTSLSASLRSLVDFQLVSNDGRYYSVGTCTLDHLAKCTQAIWDYYSIGHRRELMKDAYAKDRARLTVARNRQIVFEAKHEHLEYS